MKNEDILGFVDEGRYKGSNLRPSSYAHEHFHIRPLYGIEIVWSISIWFHHLFFGTATALNLVGKKSFICLMRVCGSEHFSQIIK